MPRVTYTQLEEQNNSLREHIKASSKDITQFVDKINILVNENGKLRATIRAIETTIQTIANLSRQDVSTRE